jgi:prepilin-type processing-associated H-X9-DG protein
MAFVEPPLAGPPEYGVVIRFAKPFQLEDLTLPVQLPLVDTQLNGRLYRQSQQPLVPGFYMPDEKTLIIATDAGLKKMLANHKNPVAGPLSRLMGTANDSSDLLLITVMESVRPLISEQLAAVPLPIAFDGVKRLPDLIDAAKIELTVTGKAGASLVLLSPSEKDAEELQVFVNEMLDIGQQLALNQVNEQMQGGDDPIELATAQYAQRITRLMIDIFRPQRDGRKLRISQEGAGGMSVATIGVLVAMLLPAVQAAREAARRMSSTNNLKEIALAMHNHHATYRKLPARAIFDDNDKPLLSWRVHLLPFLEQQALYEQFHLDEPWDSGHNRTLIERMPPVFRNPSSNAPVNLANYLIPTGPGSIFEGQEAISFRQVLDGTSNTILVLEVDDDASVIWTKPNDLDFNRDNPLARLGTAHPGGFNVALADGSVRFIAATIDPEIFLRMLMMADGNPIGF